MSTKNFTQFDLETTPLTGDYLVGYKADGSTEFRTTVDAILAEGGYNVVESNSIQPAQTISLSAVQVEAVRDLFTEQKIIARIKGLPKGIVLWSGSTEYAAASAWTNDSALARATEVLSLSSIPWAF